MLKLGTLCYIRHNGQTLMLHRIKKANDMHAGKWNGLGGKMELGETPEACIIREVLEESGLTITNPVLRGMLTFPGFSGDDDWYGFVFVARQFTGKLLDDSPEGVLAWIDDDKLLDLPLWEGDRTFLQWLDLDVFFSGRFNYVDGQLVDHDVVFYHPQSVALTAQHAVPTTTSAFQPIYTPADDTFCWSCGGTVIKRHCKIVCQTCGFTRDCSDP